MPDRMDDLRPIVLGGLEALAAAQTAAAGDIPAAQQSAAQAATVAQQAIAQRAAVAAWTPVATVAGVTAIRDQMVTMLDRQTIVMQALSDLYSYRAANDADAIRSHRAAEFLARYQFWGVV